MGLDSLVLLDDLHVLLVCSLLLLPLTCREPVLPLPPIAVAIALLLHRLYGLGCEVDSELKVQVRGRRVADGSEFGSGLRYVQERRPGTGGQTGSSAAPPQRTCSRLLTSPSRVSRS